MLENYTHITFILDGSGSMAKLVNDTIGGFNDFINKQKLVNGPCTISLMRFSSNVRNEDFIYFMKNLKDVEELTKDTYKIGGSTALLDAIGLAINKTGEKLASMAENERPEKVVVVIVTDGEENDSKTFNNKKISEMIKHQQDKYSWEFVYLGANQDAFKNASKLNIRSDSTLEFETTKIGMATLFSKTMDSMTNYRTVKGASYKIN